MAGNSRIRINGNKLVIPHVIRYDYLPCDGTMLYIWLREWEVNHITLMGGYEQYIREEAFSKIMPKVLARYYKRLFCSNIETTTIENDKIILPKRAMEHLGTDDIEMRIRKGLLEIYPAAE